ncbi:MAG: DEAD/DEAH box helicase [Candidatus Omnitrophica bacterium]|nr:DEAD/DEAH box helicase [Candidatus Omnitrophota bacterium]
MLYNDNTMIYDLFQQKAIEYIKAGFSVIVSAPTGSGKTAIAEYIITDCISNNSCVIYTAPIKALSNQKFRDFTEKFPDKIGILTGDVNINPDAPVLIMTTEIFHNKVLDEPRSLDKYSWIIFDEIHYLDDYERGSVWEESLIFLPAHMKILGLSATIPNISEFAGWIQAIHKAPVKIVTEDKRPVPLHIFYQANGKILDHPNRISFKKQHLRPNRADSLIRYLFENDKMPCIYFSFSRRRCEYLADEMRSFNFLSMEEQHKIINLYDSLCKRFDLVNEKAAAAVRPLIERGVAFHHAGMLPTLKEVIERLFTSRLIKVIFTTETFALGINMPARTVVIDELRKFYGRFHASLKTRDFYQMAGRCGRRGIDLEGFTYIRVNPNYIEPHELKRIVWGAPEEVWSKFNASYATLLNLYRKHNEKLYEIYPLSFHYFQERKKIQDKAVELLHNKVKILKELGYIRQNQLTQKGEFASRVYGYELPLSEFYERGMLERLSEYELGALCLALVYEPRKGAMHAKPDKKVKNLCNITTSLMYGVHKIEKKFKINPMSKEYHYNLSPCLDAWMNNEKFDKILHYTNADEGEIIRYFRMSLQILREIMKASDSTELKGKIKNTLCLINHGIIDAEKQLRASI